MTGNQPRQNDETAILKVLQGVYEAWNANDAEAFVADYTDDATAILPGSYRRSRTEIRESMAVGFGSFLKGSTATDQVLNLRFLNEDTAVVVTESSVRFPGETDVPEDRRAIASWVLSRRDGRWLLAAYQNSPAVSGLG